MALKDDLKEKVDEVKEDIRDKGNKYGRSLGDKVIPWFKKNGLKLVFGFIIAVAGLFLGATIVSILM